MPHAAPPPLPVLADGISPLQPTRNKNRSREDPTHLASPGGEGEEIGLTSGKGETPRGHGHHSQWER